MVAILLAGAWAFHHQYVGPDGSRPSWGKAMYITYCFIFMEHVIEALPNGTADHAAGAVSSHPSGG